MVKTILSRSSSRVSEQVDDQGMRDGKGVHTIRDSCYHKQEGAEKTGSNAPGAFLVLLLRRQDGV